MEIEAKIEYSKLKKVVEAMSKQYSVKVGLLATKGGNEEVSENLDMAGLGAVHEFGAEIDHPGGTPYFINEWGMATFVKKDSAKGRELIAKGQVTKPHHISVPARPWLSMPILRNNSKDILAKIPNSRKEIKKSSAIRITKDELIDYATQTGKFYELADVLGIAALEQINEAFDTQGFGEWTPDLPATIAKKHSEDPLIDTGRLRGAITYEVEKNG